jgi:hypothetical protein
VEDLLGKFHVVDIHLAGSSRGWNCIEETNSEPQSFRLHHYEKKSASLGHLGEVVVAGNPFAKSPNHLS